MNFLLLPLILLLMNAPASAGEIEHFCHDPEKNAEWHALSAKYPHDLNVQTLHALRIGLCEKIDLGQISVPDSIAIFEAMRKTILDRAFEQQVRERREKEDEL